MARAAVLGAISLAALVVLAGVLLTRFGGAPAQADSPHSGLDFAIGIDVDGDGTNDCGTGVPLAVGDGAPDPVGVEITDANCHAPADAELAVGVYLIDNDGIAYAGGAAEVVYTGLEPVDRGRNVWSGCEFNMVARGQGFENIACTIGIGGVAQSNLGLMSIFNFTCTQGGLLTLGTGPGQTSLVTDDLSEHRPAEADAVVITCGDLLPTTATPSFIPPGPTPQPTQCAPGQCSAPQFALGVDVDGDGTNDCGTGVPLLMGNGAPDDIPIEVSTTACTGVAGQSLTANVYLMDTGGWDYSGLSATVYHAGPAPQSRGVSVWEGCFGHAFYSWPTFENAACSIDIGPAPSMNNVGLVVRIAFTCSADGRLWIGYAYGETELLDDVRAHSDPSDHDEVSVACQDSDPRAAGDSNCNGAANSVDAALILQYSAELVLTVQCAWAADVNHDGVIDPRDAALVLQREAGLLASPV